MTDALYIFHFQSMPGEPFDLARAISALEAQRPVVHLSERRWKLPLGEVAVVPKGSDESGVWFRIPRSAPRTLLSQALSELEPIAKGLGGSLRVDGDHIELSLEERRAEGLYLVDATMAALAARHSLEHLPERLWKLDAGDVTLAIIGAEETVRALEIRVPLSDLTRVLLETLRRASAAAAAVGLVLWDPQLSRTVAAVEEPAVLHQFRQLASACDPALAPPGLAGFSTDPPPSRWSSLSRWFWLALGAGALLSLLLRR